MNYIERDLKNLKKAFHNMKSEGFLSFLKRKVREMGRRSGASARQWIVKALPIALGAIVLISVASLAAEMPLAESLMLGGVVLGLFGILQAAGSHGFTGNNRNVPRIYQYMEPSWAAADSHDERQKLWKKRREQAITLLVKLLIVAAMLNFAGIAVSVLANVMGISIPTS